MWTVGKVIRNGRKGLKIEHVGPQECAQETEGGCDLVDPKCASTRVEDTATNDELTCK